MVINCPLETAGKNAQTRNAKIIPTNFFVNTSLKYCNYYTSLITLKQYNSYKNSIYSGLRLVGLLNQALKNLRAARLTMPTASGEGF